MIENSTEASQYYKKKAKKEGNKIRQKKFLLDMCFGSHSAG